MIETSDITITVHGHSSFTFKPGSPEWDEAMGLLRGYKTEDEITNEPALCPSCGRELDDHGECGWCSEHGNDLSREADHE